jgi:hypothetical protein
MTDKREQTANIIDLVVNPADTERRTADITDKVVQSHQENSSAQDETIGVAKAIEPTAKRKIGRPRTAYKGQEHCDLVEKLGAEGKSVAQMAQACGCDVSTLYEWINENGPYYEYEFSESYARARQASQCYWEDLAQSALFNRDLNGPVLMWQVNNRFPQAYQARPELASGNVQINIQVSAEDESVT